MEKAHNSFGEQELEQKLDTNFSERLSTEIIHELSLLKLVLQHTTEIKSRLEELYQEYFPKQCGNCRKIYETREQYLTATLQLEEESTVLDYDNKVFEYRNCTCGSTMLVMMDNRRDETHWGEMRRGIFNDCLELICIETKIKQDKVVPVLREVFDKICQQVDNDQQIILKAM